MEKEFETDSNNIVEEENENGYIEEEDEDFVPDQNLDIDNGSKDDDDDDIEEDNLIKSKDYSKIESDVGGLIKTRHGRQLEMEHMAKHKYDDMMVEDLQITSKITNIWDEMQDESKRRLYDEKSARHSVISEKVPDIIETSSENTAPEEEKILIERTYKFAGETIHEKKLVPKSSAVAKEYLNSLKFDANKISDNKDDHISKNDEKIENGNGIADNDTSNSGHPPLRRPLKRPPILEDIISGSLKPKLSTLEKSKLDWVQYVDKEGISDELQYNNRDGYLAKQDFLSRVESNKDAKYKELRQKQLAMQFQAQQQQSG